MDTSKENIKMCDCEEIQSQFNEEDKGSFVYDKPSKKTFIFDDLGITHIEKRELAVWLPRQDELQKMLDNEHKFHLHYRFDMFLSSQYNSISKQNAFIILMNMFEDCSFEQLWLAFVMKEKHNKTWDGKGWINDT